jgi:hypothetical protein
MSKNDKDGAAKLQATKAARIDMFPIHNLEVSDEEYIRDDGDEVPPDDQSICPDARFPAAARELIKTDSRYMFVSKRDLAQADTNAWAAARHDLTAMCEGLAKTDVAKMLDGVIAEIDSILAERPDWMQDIAREWSGLETVTVKITQSH